MDAELQNKYMELQFLDKQLKQLQQHLQLFEQQMDELEILKESLHDLPNIKPGTETLVPISAGIYLKAKIENVNNLIVNVGSKIGVEKSVKDSEAMIDEQLAELRDHQLKLTLNLNMLVQRAQELEKEIVGLSNKENV